MRTLSELVVSKPVSVVFKEYKTSEDTVPLVERKKALNNYYDKLESVELTNLQKSFLHYLQKAVYNRDVNKLAGVLRYALKLFTIDEFEALRVRFGRSLEIDDHSWFISTYNHILKHDALAVGRLDIVAKVLERETGQPSRTSELAVIKKELEDFYNYHDVVVFKKKVHEVINTTLTEQERTYALVLLEAIENKDLVLLDNTVILGENTLEVDVLGWVFNIATTTLNEQDDRWLKVAFKKLGLWIV